jgi:hypothetical protein
MTRVLQDILLGSGNSDPLESRGDILVSRGSGKGILISAKRAIAAAGHTQSTGTQLTEQFNMVETSTAGTADAVVLCSRVADGYVQTVAHQGTAILSVYPALSQRFVGSAANVAFLLASGVGATFYGVGEGVIVPNRFTK